jgi:hypothetical protein
MEQIIKIQRSYNQNLRKEVTEFVAAIPRRDLASILLSGSTARGDFCPGRFGGMIDLTVMVNVGSKVRTSDIFGENEEPEIPYHCVKRGGNWYQIAFHEFIDHRKFQLLDESKKFALLESEVIWENEGCYSREYEIIRKYALVDQNKLKGECLGYISYLLSEYKEDRWFRRDAFVQLHANLNTAIQHALKCLFYMNELYAPAEDRRMYYAFSLPKIPSGFASLMASLHQQQIDSESDYERRKNLFNDQFLDYINRVGT